MLVKDTAICIRAVDYSETSQIVTFFTRATGKISAIAKGSKRPKSKFDGPIELFSYGNIVFSDSSRERLATLTEFEQKPAFTHLADNLFTLNCCLFAVELLSSLTDEYDPHAELFDGFLGFLQNANEGRRTTISHPRRVLRTAESNEQRNVLTLLILFQLTLLKEVGLQPVLSHCVNCKTNIEHRASSIEYRVYFSSSGNGLICRDCEASFPDKIRLTKDAANCLTNLKLITGVNEKTLNEIEKILIYHFTETLGRPAKMAKYILKS